MKETVEEEGSTYISGDVYVQTFSLNDSRVYSASMYSLFVTIPIYFLRSQLIECTARGEPLFLIDSTSMEDENS